MENWSKSGDISNLLSYSHLAIGPSTATNPAYSALPPAKPFSSFHCTTNRSTHQATHFALKLSVLTLAKLSTNTIRVRSWPFAPPKSRKRRISCAKITMALVAGPLARIKLGASGTGGGRSVGELPDRSRREKISVRMQENGAVMSGWWMLRARGTVQMVYDP